jgi:hypothetical protein
MMPKIQQQEVDQNYAAFEALLPAILPMHRGQFALMKDGQVLGYYSTATDARSAAEMAIRDGLFSIQHVTDSAINLGFYTDAMSVRV